MAWVNASTKLRSYSNGSSKLLLALAHANHLFEEHTALRLHQAEVIYNFDNKIFDVGIDLQIPCLERKVGQKLKLLVSKLTKECLRLVRMKPL